MPHIVACDAFRISDPARTVPVRPFWRISWHRDCGARLRETGGRWWKFDPDFIVVIPPGTSVEHDLRVGIRACYIHGFAGQPFDRYRGPLLRVFVGSETRNLLESICAMFERGNGDKRPDAASRLRMRALFLRVLTEIPDGDWPGPPPDARIRGALARIETAAATGRKLTNPQLARVAGMSVNAFIRRFGEEVGKSPQDYQLACRLERACALLQGREQTIETVAEACGFCDRFDFTRMFRRRFGAGPATWRRDILDPPAAGGRHSGT